MLQALLLNFDGDAAIASLNVVLSVATLGKGVAVTLGLCAHIAVCSLSSRSFISLSGSQPMLIHRNHAAGWFDRRVHH